MALGGLRFCKMLEEGGATDKGLALFSAQVAMKVCIVAELLKLARSLSAAYRSGGHLVLLWAIQQAGCTPTYCLFSTPVEGFLLVCLQNTFLLSQEDVYA